MDSTPSPPAQPMQPDLALHLSAPLQTSRLALEPLGARHAPEFFAPMQDDALYEWISMPKPDDPVALRAHWARLESRLAPDGRAAWPTWALRRLGDGVCIGRVDAEVCLAADGTLVAPNFGYYLFPPYWGQGYASEAVAAASQALLARGVQRLVATVTVGNHASARVLCKAGFVHRRRLAANDLIRGRVVDDDEYLLAATGPGTATAPARGRGRA